MNRTILIIDDEELQAKNLASALENALPDSCVLYEWRKEEIEKAVICNFYSIALVDLRMDRYDKDGFDVINLISDVNPFAKIIAVSAYTEEYMSKLSDYMSKGKLLSISDKEEYDIWIPKLKDIITNYYNKGLNTIAVQVLEDSFASAKNETDIFKKGKLFEDFVVNMFRQMGFIHIETRARDAASNEIDLILRNDINDPFFSKFSRYIYIECKNKDSGFDKNDFIVFNNKIQSSYGNCDIGIVITTGYIKNTVFLESLKDSKYNSKIVFLSSAEIMRIIHTPKMLDELKEIIDEQVLKYHV